MKIRSGIVAMNLITGHAVGILTSLYILKFPLSFQGLSWSWLGKSCLIGPLLKLLSMENT